MDIIRIASLGIVVCFIVLVLKNKSPEYALFITLMASIGILVFLIGGISSVFNFLQSYSSRFDWSKLYLGTILKMTGIAYITEFSSDLCKDAGIVSMASKIDLAGKVIVAALAIPIFATLFDIIITIMP